ncbi:MAG TPA: serine/threonine-protein kinase [Luteitalea sp.]|nr:serine/threonine-protein kinase [Luteitalea sp.]
MGAQRTRLLELAASVADGTVDIDWKDLEASVHDEDDRQLLQDLRVLAGVAELHRSDIPPSSRGRVVGRIGPAMAETDAPTVEERVLPPPSTKPLDTWGHLELIEQIGQGSFGNVYRARDTRLDRDVALKLLRKGRQTAELAEKILHEGRILARVRHRNVVTVFGAEERDGRVGLWMEYIRGRTLEQLLRSTGSFGAREAALIGQELCRALAAVHKAGLVHRDIKAQNVMREEGGRLVLMDFGAGQYVQGSGAAPTGRLTGTPLYLAPELLAGGEATVRSDIYSLGVVLFHLVTGQYPVSATSLDDLRQAHLEGRRFRLHDARPDLADDFARVVERAAHPDPDRRYSSCGALQEALARSLGLDSTISVDREALAAAMGAVNPTATIDSPLPVEASGASRRWAFRWWHVAGVGFLLGAVLVAMLAWLLPRQPDVALQRTTGLKPIVAIRPMPDVASAFDPQTFAVAASLGHRLRSSPEIRVTSPDAVAALNDTATTSASIMATLQSDAVIELRPIRREADGFHVNARILMAGALPIALPPIGPAANLDGLGDALASALAPHLRLDPEVLHGAGGARVVGNDEALAHYARGLRHSATEGDAAMEQACVAFKASTDADPTFAAGYARWAQCLLTRYRSGAIKAADAFSYARSAASMALAREPDNADAHAALADLYAEEQQDWGRAESEFHRALASDGSNVYARARYGMLLAGRGRTAEAVEQLTEALRTSPLSGSVKGYAAIALHYSGRDEEALAMFQQLRAVDSSLESALVGQCRIYVVVGKYADALTVCRQLLHRRRGQDAFAQAQIAAALGRSGQEAESGKFLQQLRAQMDAATADERPNVAFFLATAYAGLEQPEQVFPWLEIAARGKSSRLSYLRVDPRFTVVRGDPRWAQILATYEARP